MEQMLLIHGALGSESQMLPLKRLLEKSFKVHVLEFEGHGHTANYSKPFTTSEFIDQLIGKINSLKAPTHLFGYSMGGYIALLTAAKGNDHILSLTTLGVKMKWSPAIAEKEVRNLNPELILEKVPGFASALEKNHGEHWKDVVLRTADFMKDLGHSSPMSKEMMSHISIPVQLLLSDGDKMVTREETEEVKKWIVGSEFQLLCDSHHPFEKSNMEDLRSKMIEFIGKQ